MFFVGLIYMLKRVLVFIGLMLPILLSFSRVYGQVSALQLTNRLNALTNRYGPSVYRVRDDLGPAVLSGLFQSDAADSLALAKNRSSESYQAFVKGDWGLKATGGYINNFSDGFEESGFFYRSSYILGLDWNILKEGIIDNRLSAKQTHYRDLISNTLYQKGNVTALNFILDKIKRRFDSDLELKKKFNLQFLSEFENLARDLYLGRYILWEDFLDISNRRKELGLELEDPGYIEHKALRPYTNSDKLPVLELVDSALFSAFAIHHEKDSLLKLREAENRLKYNYWREISLRPYLRYNHFSYSTAQPNRDFLSAGFAFAVPLPTRSRSREFLQSSSTNELRSELDQIVQIDLMRLKDLVNLYQAASSDYLKQLNGCHIIEEQLRKENVKRELGDPEYSALRTLRLVKEWIEKDVSMVEVKRDLYLLVVRISNLVNASPETFTIPMDISFENFVPQTSKEKAVYIWSSTLRKWDVSALSADVAAKGFSRVLLSIDMNDTLRLQALDLIAALKEKDVAVELMVANNSLVLSENSERLSEVLNFNLNVPGISGIHLDIEPHARGDWKEKSGALMGEYQKMIENAHALAAAKNQTISISIPVSYDMKYLVPVRDRIQQVYIMAYEHPDVGYIARKIKEEVFEFQDKVVIALSVKDFKDQQELDLFMEKLERSTGINRFAIHDFRQLKELETKAK